MDSESEVVSEVSSVSVSEVVSEVSSDSDSEVDEVELLGLESEEVADDESVVAESVVGSVVVSVVSSVSVSVMVSESWGQPSGPSTMQELLLSIPARDKTDSRTHPLSAVSRSMPGQWLLVQIDVSSSTALSRQNWLGVIEGERFRAFSQCAWKEVTWKQASGRALVARMPRPRMLSLRRFFRWGDLGGRCGRECFWRRSVMVEDFWF